MKTIEEMKKAVEERKSETRMIHADGFDIEEKIYLKFEEMSEAAKEFYEDTILLDDETMCLYDLYCREVIELYVFVKYFTDFDVSGIETLEDKVVLFNYLYPWVYESCELNECMGLVRAMAERMTFGTKTLYTGRTSIINKISVMAKDMDINENWIEEYAKSREVNQEMIELLGEHMKTKEKENQTKPTIGGNVVSLSSFGKKG